MRPSPAAEAATRPRVRIDMVRIPGGAFVMGTDDGEAWEGPTRRVVLPTFWIDRREVTNAEYWQFVRSTGHRRPHLEEAWAAAFAWTPAGPPPGKDDFPVTLVDRDDAAAFCEWRGAHLPTPWEWEKAYRGDDGRLYPWGDTWDASRANLRDGGEVDGVKTVAPVDAFPDDLSPHGVVGMAGNVAEWVAGDFAEALGLALDHRDRPVRQDQLPREAGIAERRGGHWLQPLPLYAAGHVRWRVDATERTTLTGFRCAASRRERRR